METTPVRLETAVATRSLHGTVRAAALAVLLLALLAQSLGGGLTGAAWAQEPEGEDAPAEDAPPEDTATDQLVAEPRCEPTTGFDYEFVVDETDGPLTYHLTWKELGDPGPGQDVDGRTGSVDSGPGVFVLEGVALADGDLVFEGRTRVIVDCPETDPTVTLDVRPVCDPEPGFEYQISVAPEPEDLESYELLWRELGGVLDLETDQSGFVASGEGSFEVRGVVITQAQFRYESEWVVVTVDCSDDPDPDIRRRRPNFTG
jgi:hypothetical protein